MTAGNFVSINFSSVVCFGPAMKLNAFFTVSNTPECEPATVVER